MSFAQEMRDFVDAWTAVSDIGNKKKQLDLQKEEIENLKAYRDESLALDREQLELSKANSARSAALAAERNAIAKKAAEAKGHEAVLAATDGMIAGATAGADWSPVGETPTYLPQDTGSAIPTGPADTAEPDPMLSFEENYGFSRGGLVPHAQEGGLIEEDPDLPFTDPQNPYVDPKMNEEMRRRQAAIPTGPNEPLPTGAVESSPRPEPKPEAQPDPEAAAKVVSGAKAAVEDAAPALLEEAKKKPAAVGPDAEGDKIDIVTGQGGLSMEEWKQLIATIDPNDSIPAYLKSAAALATTHRYFMENGEPEKARKMAMGILVLNKQMTQTLGLLAENAMKEGNIPAAAKLVSDAANQFPTGDQFKVEVGPNGTIAYTVMKDGEEAGTGQLNPAQLWELTGKVKDGSLFIEEMGRLAQPSGNKAIGPTEALDLTAKARVNAVQAVEELNAATEAGDLSTEELNALRERARNATATYNKFYGNAINMGIKRTDIEARANDMIELAIPDAEQPEGGLFSSEEGGVTSDGNAVEFDNLPAPRTREERDALPPGTKYVAPDGSIRTR